MIISSDKITISSSRPNRGVSLLSQRLYSLARYHSDHESVWDIGCDHGLLGLSFCHTKHVKVIHLVDPSIKVIKVLEAKVKDSYITNPVKICIQHEFGQRIKLDNEKKIIFIAGMGGKEIELIARHLIPQMHEGDSLVVSPHRNFLALRSFLGSTELGLFDELVIKEDELFYQVICLIKSSHLPKITRFGDKIWKGIDGEEYRQHILRTFSIHQDQASRELVSHLEQLST